jgi:hypothetical protein
MKLNVCDVCILLAITYTNVECSAVATFWANLDEIE